MTKGTGKKKIDIKKIANNSARSVTFSKRRTGLFKKAQELEKKSGARVALLVFSPSGRLYTSGNVSLFENNGFSSKPHQSTEIASNLYMKPSTLCLKKFNVEDSTEIFSTADRLYSSGEVSLVNDDLKNNGFSSKSHLSTEIASNSYAEPSTLCKGCTEIFSPAGRFYSSDEYSFVDDNLKNNGFTTKSHQSTETASNSYSEPSTLRLKTFNVEDSTEIFSPAGRFYSSGEFPIVNENLKNNGFCSKSDLCTDFGSNLYGDWSTLWLGNLNVEECSSVDELMLLKEKLEEKRDKLVLKMEAEFIESLIS